MRNRGLEYFLSFVLNFFVVFSYGQLPQALDSTQTPPSNIADTTIAQSFLTNTVRTSGDSSFAVSPKVNNGRSIIDELLARNPFINVRDAPVNFITEKSHFKGEEFLFYLLCVVVLTLGTFKTFYNSYFKNLFRVYFNTSLRQSQLTDQLLQARLPSFILNIFFAMSAGIFCWLLLRRYNFETSIHKRWLLPFCILAIALLYFLKYCTLKFIGWVTNMRETVDSYIFVIFLINKISGIALVPFIIILAFSAPLLVYYFTTISWLLLAVFFLSRYIKIYGVLQNKLPMNAFHFLVYITATEVLPLLLIYKITMDYLL